MGYVNGDKSSLNVHNSRCFLVREAFELTHGRLSGDRKPNADAQAARERSRQARERGISRSGSIQAWRAE